MRASDAGVRSAGIDSSMSQPVDWTEILIHVIGIFSSYFFGRRRGRSARKDGD